MSREVFKVVESNKMLGKIKVIPKQKASYQTPPEDKTFYTHEDTFIRWCMYVTKHLPFMPFEIWAIIFKKVQLCEKDYRKRELLAIRSGTMSARNKILYPCREYNLSKNTFRAYYVEGMYQLNHLGKDGCPYLYMDRNYIIKQCQWNKLGKEIKSYKLPKFVSEYCTLGGNKKFESFMTRVNELEDRGKRLNQIAWADPLCRLFRNFLNDQEGIPGHTLKVFLRGLSEMVMSGKTSVFDSYMKYLNYM